MTPAARRAAPGLLALFAAATAVNAALLFLVEPMFTRMVLPALGGTPAVWNTCLVFFQGALLVGYLYAHVTSRWLPVPRQALLHVALLAAGAAWLPLALPTGAAPPAGTTLATIGWLLGVLATTLGVPFTLLAAGAPMLQRWLASTAHPQARNPYVLYAASNAGSFVALLAYPALVEPRWRLGEQGARWAVGYGALVLLVAVAATLAWRGGRAGGTAGGETVTPDAGKEASVAVGGGPPRPAPTLLPTPAWRLRWLLLSFVPSSLLLGVTSFLGTDIASVPFLWVLPLALYLLTFTLVFAERPPLDRRVMLALQAVAVLALIVTIGANPARRLSAVAALHLVTFFVTTMACHRELAEARPRADHLTEFYLWVSLGGLLGGIFNAVLAPVLYDRVLEYPLALVLSLALRPTWGSPSSPRRAALLDVAIPLALLGVVTLGYQLPPLPGALASRTLPLFLGAVAFVAALGHRRPLRLALSAAALFVGTELALREASDTILQARSFFGVYRVRRYGDYTLLQHGTTTHGGQARAATQRTEPLTYYHRGGPLGDLFRLATDTTAPRAVALVGLGTGTTACYARPGERWTYYEIDPLVVAIAREPRLFTYLRDCQPDVRIVLGDARRSLAAVPARTLDLLVLDAFSSDAIPVHLLTREALAEYRRVLRPAGIVAFHVSNRYLDLRPVLAEAAREARMAGAMIDRDVTDAEKAQLRYGSRWVALAMSARVLAPLVRTAGWEVLPPSAPVRAWTDDYSDVLGLLLARRREAPRDPSAATPR